MSFQTSITIMTFGFCLVCLTVALGNMGFDLSRYQGACDCHSTIEKTDRRVGE